MPRQPVLLPADVITVCPLTMRTWLSSHSASAGVADGHPVAAGGGELDLTAGGGELDLDVVAVAAVDDVGAAATEEHVVAGAAQQHVVAVSRR